ncbi:MAG: ATP-binding protein [Gemmatimonadota bacterium]
MKELLVLSGKGGTGKTAVTASFAHLSHLDSDLPGAVFVDADVDAANLDLLIGAAPLEEHDFQGGHIANIDPELCITCGICQEVCRFDAVGYTDFTAEFLVDPLGCEGCAACYYECPVDAISMLPRLSGHWFRSESRFGPLFHARLRPAQENSGKLVSLVREEGEKAAMDEGYPLLIVDGPPGIACPAIASVTGVDLVLIVTEPTVSGLHDLERVGRLTAHFGVETLVCINKADLYPAGAAKVEECCETLGLSLLGAIPFDETVTQALVKGKPVTEYRPESKASEALRKLWTDVKHALGMPQSIGVASGGA